MSAKGSGALKYWHYVANLRGVTQVSILDLYLNWIIIQKEGLFDDYLKLYSPKEMSHQIARPDPTAFTVIAITLPWRPIRK